MSIGTAQTALVAAARVHAGVNYQGHRTNIDGSVQETAERFYEWLESKREASEYEKVSKPTSFLHQPGGPLR